MSLALFQDTANAPRRGDPPGPTPERRPPREPVFNAPGPAIALVVIILGGYALQLSLPQQVVEAFAFSPQDLGDGRWYTLISAIFIHKNWEHAGFNAAFALAFATPVARFLGHRATSVALFFLFYLLCGALSFLGFALDHLGAAVGALGASGAVSGLMGCLLYTSPSPRD